jgi:two-component system sensor histidine kinase RegB
VIDAPWLSLARRVTGGPDRTGARNMRQLVELRWLAVAGQLVTILIVGGPMRVPLPLVAMLSIVGAQALVNLASVPRMRQRTIGNLELFVALLFDIAALTAQLALSGGATNPFVSLFLLQVVLGAILLEAWAAWGVVAITSACFALLTVVYRPLRLPPTLELDAADLFTLGAWLCFGLIATLLMMFVTRITRNLRARDARLADLRQQATEEDHIVRMGMLASGAAHELGTPLASLSVALSDWRRMPVFQRHRDLQAEIAEMQGEVARCKAIVTGILQSAGEPRGEAPEVVSAHVFLDRVVAEWRATHAAIPLDYRREAVADVAIVADPALRQAIANVLDNAGEASPAGIELEASRADGELVVAVRDRGAGFAPGLLADFGKPYISTKGSGHGVGLFLAVNVVRKLGGRAEAANRTGGGAVVTLTLPLSTIGMTGDAR